MPATRLRSLSLLAAGVLIFGACSSGTGSSAAPSGASADCAGSGTTGAAGAPEIPDVVDGKFNVAMVLIGPHDDGGWSQAHYEGLQYVCENVPDAHTAYIELVPEGADSEQVFRSLARKGFDFIIGTSFGYMDPMATVAEEFPDATFLHLTGYKSNFKNFGNFFGAMEDFKYLAGMLAGSRAVKDGVEKIGYMATFPIPEELRLGNAIMRGVKVTCPDCTMDIRFINTWHDPQLERDAAASLFDAGAQVVFTGADTPAVADVAQEKGKWAVTYDHPSSCKVDAVPDRAVLDLGPRVRPDRRAGQGRDLRSRLRVLRCRLQGDGPVRVHGRRDADQGRRGPARGRRHGRQGPARQDAGRRLRTVRCLRRSDRRQHRQGAAAGRPKLEQSDLDQFPPGAPGSECKTCMYWWNEGITTELPPLSTELASPTPRPTAVRRGPPLPSHGTDRMTSPAPAPATAGPAADPPRLPPSRRAASSRPSPASSPTTMSTSTSGPARSTRSSARTAPARARS